MAALTDLKMNKNHEFDIYTITMTKIFKSDGRLWATIAQYF